MVTIQLYQPKKYDEFIKFAENWNELLTLELEAIARHMLVTDVPANVIKANLLLELLVIRSKDANLKDLLDAEDCAINGLPLINFIFAENNLTKQPYPKLLLNDIVYLGPVDHFDTIQTGEYEEAFIHFLKFKEDNNADHLVAMAAVLYRQQGVKFITYNADIAENVVYEYEKVLPVFKQLTAVQLYTIYMWFTGCQAMLQLIFSNVYNSGSDDAAPDLLVFTKCIHAAAGPKNGSRDAIRRMLLKELLFDMEQESIKQKELEEFYKNQK